MALSVLWGRTGELSLVTVAETLSTEGEEKCPRARSLTVAHGRNLDHTEVVVARVTGASQGPIQALGDLVQALRLLRPLDLLVSAVVRVSLHSLLLWTSSTLRGHNGCAQPQAKAKTEKNPLVQQACVTSLLQRVGDSVSTRASPQCLMPGQFEPWSNMGPDDFLAFHDLTKCPPKHTFGVFVCLFCFGTHP